VLRIANSSSLLSSLFLESRCNAAVSKIKAEHGSNRSGSITPATLDLSSFKSVDDFTPPVQIDYLFLNAGFATPPARSLTVDGYETGLQTMHFSHFHLTQGLLASGGLSGGSRVVATSSAASQFGNFDRSLFEDKEGEGDLRGEVTKATNPMMMYGRAKLANLLYMKELYKRYESSGLTTCSCHIGAVATSIWDMPEIVSFLQPLVDWYVSKTMRTLEEGSRILLRCALDRKEVVGEGNYLDGMGFVRDAKWMSDNSKDDKLAKRLWEVSEMVVDKHVGE
jgi:NAD(P)-dependent dehydrogenase (short-subunit alcohol dehydrogenase family)